MACINPDGTLTASAQTVLQTTEKPVTVAEIAQIAGYPVYRVRSSLRELVNAGLIAEQEGRYQITPQGKEKL